VQNRSIRTLAGRAQARYRQTCGGCTKSLQPAGFPAGALSKNHHGGGMRIALYQPDIPQNTGTILRLCACLQVEAHIIEPSGFPVRDRHFRRSGMDYLDQVSIERHASWSHFDDWRRQRGCRLVLFTTKGALPYLAHRFETNDILLFGRESAGVPEEV